MSQPLPPMCDEGYSLRWAYLKEAEFMFKMVLMVEYQEHLKSCKTCQARMQTEAERASGAAIIDFDLEGK